MLLGHSPSVVELFFVKSKQVLLVPIYIKTVFKGYLKKIKRVFKKNFNTLINYGNILEKNLKYKS